MFYPPDGSLALLPEGGFNIKTMTLAEYREEKDNLAAEAFMCAQALPLKHGFCLLSAKYVTGYTYPKFDYVFSLPTEKMSTFVVVFLPETFELLVNIKAPAKYVKHAALIANVLQKNHYDLHMRMEILEKKHINFLFV